MKVKAKLKAVTLIESLIYLGIFAFIFITIMQFVFNVGETVQIASDRNEMEQTSIFIDMHILESFTKANSIDLLNSTLTNNNGKLRLTKVNGNYMEYSILNERINFSDNGTNYYLTSQDMIVDRMYLERVNDVQGDIIGIKTTIDFVAAENPGNVKTLVTSFLL